MSSDLDPESFLKALRKANLLEVFIASFIALPFVFNAWLGIADKLVLSLPIKRWALLPFLFVLYIVGVAAVLIVNSRNRRRGVARDLIVGYLTSKKYQMVSFERIRSNINPGFTDEFLKSLAVHFPNILRSAKLKNARAGLAIITEERFEDEG
jgi:hypothetical protein